MDSTNDPKTLLEKTLGDIVNDGNFDDDIAEDIRARYQRKFEKELEKEFAKRRKFMALKVTNPTERMIFGKTYTEKQREWEHLCEKLTKEKYNPRWFAWLPVRLDDGRWAWLTTVKRTRKIWVFGKKSSEWTRPPRIEWIYCSTTMFAEMANLDTPEELPQFRDGVEVYQWSLNRD